MLIEMEGIDGVGKTTQCRMLKNWFENRGERAIIVKDLESTQLGRKIKSIFVTDAPRSKEVELFGFLCCKANLFSEIIANEVADNSHIICDRGTGSFLSYFEVMGFNREFLRSTLAVLLPKHYVPATVLIDLSVQEAMSRNVAKPTHSKFDNMGALFFEKQRKVFKELAEDGRWFVVDGSGSITSVHKSIFNSVEKMLGH